MMYGFRKGLAAAAFSAVIVAGACATSQEQDTVSAGPSTGAPSSAAPGQTGAPSAQTPRTAMQGVYTAAQAERGNTAYQTSCSACHNTQEFTGAGFQATWGAGPVGDIHQFISEMMPLHAPGSLPDQQYSDIVAYILRQNGYPAGQTELPTSNEALQQIEYGGAPQ